jgi:2-keto-4-pentenoate hydratase/2-oxohepta-3-ene-1,7-dioic acid hydratase in catechol pathway
MKYCRFVQDKQHHYGLVESVAGHDTITRLLIAQPGFTGKLDELPTRKIEHLRLSDAHLVAPTLPSKIICVGRNYAEHVHELNNLMPKEELVLFLKPPSAVIGPGEKIVKPPESERVDHEGELAVIIGKRCRNLREDEDVREYIRGYTCVNDVTARDIQKQDTQWTRGKGFDTFCPVGPVVNDELDPWAGVDVETRVSGEVRQKGNTRDFIFTLDFVIRYISRVMTLFPGDLIPTGTPAGVGPLKAGDVVEVQVEGIGTLRNLVVDEQPQPAAVPAAS